MTGKRDPEVTILNYLDKQNRPYSAIDIFNNLHKEFGKTAVVKSLESLAQQNKIIEKTYGKQKVYAPLQDKYGDINQEEMKAMDTKIVDLQEELQKLQQEVKHQEKDIDIFSKEMSLNELLTENEKYKNLNSEYAQKIKKLKSGTSLISKEERKKIYERKDKMVSQWKKRKRMTNDILECILEGYPKPKKTLIEETGVETDEELGIKLPL